MEKSDFLKMSLKKRQLLFELIQQYGYEIAVWSVLDAGTEEYDQSLHDQEVMIIKMRKLLGLKDKDAKE